MNGKRFKFAWLTLFLLSGCASTVDQYLKVHPDTPPSIKSSMSSNLLCIGMTKEQVNAVRGKPSQTTQDEPENKETWIYTRPSSLYCAFENDKLIRLEDEKQRHERKIGEYFKFHPERSQFKDSIIGKQLRIGMNKEEAKLSLGEPKEINKNGTPYSSFEQWLYDSTDSPNYLYFSDDKLVSWHD